MSALQEYWDAAPELAERMERAEEYARAELESLRKDAERYRWLRRRQVECTPHVAISEQASGKLDAAIDAAMKEKP